MAGEASTSAFEAGSVPTYTEWEEVYRDNVVGMYQYVYRRVGNAPDAEDLAAEVLLHTLRTLRFPSPVRNVRAYLVKTAKTVLADHWRRHYAAPEVVSDELDELAAPEPTTWEPSALAAERAQRVLALLPDRFRTALELRFMRGYSVAEIARELGVTPTHARVIQYRALRKAAEVGRDLMP